MIGKIRAFWSLPPAKRALLMEAGFALLIGAVMANLPLNGYARWLGEQRSVTPSDVSPDHEEDRDTEVESIGWAIRLIANRVPFRSNCLPQAIAARIMLGRRHLPVTITLGVAFANDKSALTAHAWSQSGALVLTGNAVRRAYTPVANFHHRPKE